MTPETSPTVAKKLISAKRKRRRRGCPYYLCGVLSLVGSALTVALWVAQRYYVDQSQWAFMLTYGPQVAFIFMPLGLAGLALLLWQWRWVGYNLILALVVLQVFVQPTWPHLPRKAAPERTIRVVSWNVHEEFTRTRELTAALQPLEPDIVCLQEAWRESFRELLPGYTAADSHDVTTLTKGRIISSREFRLGDSPNWRYGLETVIELPQGRVTVCNVHWLAVQMPIHVGLRLGDPNDHEKSKLGRDKQEAVTLAWLRDVRGPALLVGDFNTPPNVAEYRRLAAEATNAWEAGRGFGFTYYQKKPIIRIDHVWCRNGIKPIRCQVLDGKVSDHLLVVADVALPEGE